MVEIGQAVSGVVSDIHSENIVVLLHPNNVRALISISNLANSRGISDVELRGLLARGETLDDLIVVSRNLDKGIVIVAKQPKNATKQRSGVKLSTVTAGDKVSGRVARYSRQGAIVQFPGQITGSLHPTDACDDFEKGTSVPSIGTAIEAVVLRVDKHKRQLILSTRQSRVGCDQNHVVVDREINDVTDLNVDDSVRGFVKSISDKGVFVSLGRDVDARVLIKELFDDVS
jgi:rRNA biogenesis protein RRP5